MQKVLYGGHCSLTSEMVLAVLSRLPNLDAEAIECISSHRSSFIILLNTMACDPVLKWNFTQRGGSDLTPPPLLLFDIWQLFFFGRGSRYLDLKGTHSHFHSDCPITPGCPQLRPLLAPPSGEHRDGSWDR